MSALDQSSHWCAAFPAGDEYWSEAESVGASAARDRYLGSAKATVSVSRDSVGRSWSMCRTCRETLL